MATESFDDVLNIESKEDVDRMMAALKKSSETVKTSDFDFQDQDDVKAIQEIFGH